MEPVASGDGLTIMWENNGNYKADAERSRGEEWR